MIFPFFILSRTNWFLYFKTQNFNHLWHLLNTIKFLSEYSLCVIFTKSKIKHRFVAICAPCRRRSAAFQTQISVRDSGFSRCRRLHRLSFAQHFSCFTVSSSCSQSSIRLFPTHSLSQPRLHHFSSFSSLQSLPLSSSFLLASTSSSNTREFTQHSHTPDFFSLSSFFILLFLLSSFICSIFQID